MTNIVRPTANGEPAAIATYTKAVYGLNADGTPGERLDHTLEGIQAGLYRPNLLVNGDFWVNQRGQQSYSAPGYTVDGWKLTSGTLTVTADGVALNGTLVQTLEGAVGADTTAAVEMVSGTAAQSYDDTARTFTITSTGGTLRRAKLELGAHFTGACIEDPATTMLRCQRCYISTLDEPMPAVFANYNASVVWVPFPVVMRVAPLVTVYDWDKTPGKYWIGSQGAQSIEAADVTSSRYGFFIIPRGKGAAENNHICFHYSATAEL